MDNDERIATEAASLLPQAHVEESYDDSGSNPGDPSRFRPTHADGDDREDAFSEILSLASLESSKESVASANRVNAISGVEGSPGTECDAEATAPVEQTKTSSSEKSHRVPALEKRGLLSKIVLVPEYHDARDYPPKIKYLLVAIIAFAAITGPMGTSIMLPAIDDIVENLDTSVAMVNVSVGIYLLALGIFPLWWSALSEKYGRRSIYLVSFSMFLAFSIGTSLSPSISALIVLRILQGGGSASVQAVGAGTISDLFPPHDRGVAMGYYYLGPLCGPFLAPILGGVVAQAWGWRATQWLMVIFSGCNLILIIFCLPETLRKGDNMAAIRDMLRDTSEVGNKEMGEETDNYQISDAQLARIATNLTRISSRRSGLSLRELDGGPVVDSLMPTLARLNTNKSSYSRKVAQELIDEELKRSELENDPTQKDSFKTTMYDCIIRPTHSLVLLKHPPVALVISYSAVCFAVIYFFNMTISYEYAREPYNFSSIIIGLMYIPNSLTYVAASIIGGKWNDHLLRTYAKSHNGELVPESRISWNIVTAIILFPPACLIFGWTLKYGEFWLVPLIGTAIFGFASMLVIGATVTYLVDTLPGKGATGVALNNLIRQILAAIATFIAEPLLRAIGPGVLFSILMGIMTVSSVSLIVLKRKGSYFRDNYDLGKLYDKL